MTILATLKKRLMKNPKFRTEYEKADAEFSIVDIAPLRRSHGEEAADRIDGLEAGRTASFP